MFDAIFGGGTDTSNLTSGSDDANSYLKKGLRAGKNVLKNYEDKSVESLASGLSAANPIYRDAANNYDPYMQNGNQLNQFYTDQLTPGATDHYVNTSGYDAVRDAGEQSIMRNNAAMGGTASGINATDLDRYNVGLQEQYRQQYLDNLFRGGQQGLQAAQGQAGVLQNLGSITNQKGINTANVQQDTGRGIADLLSGTRSAQATNAYNTGLGLQNQTNADAATQASLLTAILGGGASVLGASLGKPVTNYNIG
jgi:hypothetical protein